MPKTSQKKTEKKEAPTPTDSFERSIVEFNSQILTTVQAERDVTRQLAEKIQEKRELLLAKERELEEKEKTLTARENEINAAYEELNRKQNVVRSNEKLGQDLAANERALARAIEENKKAQEALAEVNQREELLKVKQLKLEADRKNYKEEIKQEIVGKQLESLGISI